MAERRRVLGAGSLKLQVIGTGAPLDETSSRPYVNPDHCPRMEWDLAPVVLEVQDSFILLANLTPEQFAGPVDGGAQGPSLREQYAQCL